MNSEKEIPGPRQEIQPPPPKQTPAQTKTPVPENLRARAAQSCVREMPGGPVDAATLAQFEATLDTPDETAMLTAQSRLLDIMFGRLVVESTHYGYIRPEMLHFALRTQKQCRDTLRALHDVKVHEDKKSGKRTDTGAGEIAGDKP